jgi:hypothetical protein
MLYQARYYNTLDQVWDFLEQYGTRVVFDLRICTQIQASMMGQLLPADLCVTKRVFEQKTEVISILSNLVLKLGLISMLVWVLQTGKLKIDIDHNNML